LTLDPYRPPSAELSPLEIDASRTFCFAFLILGETLTAGLGLGSEYLGSLILSHADVLDRAEWNQAWLDRIVVHYSFAFIGAAAAGSIGRVRAGPRWTFFAPFVGLGFVLVEAFFRWQLLGMTGPAGDVHLLIVLFAGVPTLALVVLSALASSLIAGSIRRKHSSRRAA
jgi:hypothetical protein